jgi:hypothetical protein
MIMYAMITQEQLFMELKNYNTEQRAIIEEKYKKIKNRQKRCGCKKKPVIQSR